MTPQTFDATDPGPPPDCSCSFLDGGNFTTYLSTVKTWLDANPTEVVSMVLVNSDGIAPSVWGAAYASAGLSDYVYTPSSVPIARDDWPTLGTLITAGTRLVNFLAQEADFASVPFLIDEFSNVWETPYDVTDASFPCSVDRVTGTYSTHMVRKRSSPDRTARANHSSADSLLVGLLAQYMINHFLDVNETILGSTFPVPATAKLLTTNAATGTGSLGAQKDECVALAGYQPTFTLVDFYDVGAGSVFQYAATVNGVKYNAATIGDATSSSSGTKATTTGSGGSVTSSSLNAGGVVRPGVLGAVVAVVVAGGVGGAVVW